MEFGPFPVERAEGAILAHSMRGAGYALKKGVTLSAGDIDDLRAAGVTEVIVARKSSQDIGEDRAARGIASWANGGGLVSDRAFTGRCNLRAEASGILRVDVAAVNAANAVDEALTLATPADFTRLAKGQLAATAKVIPYAVDHHAYEDVRGLLKGALTLHPFQPMRSALIVTRANGQKESIVEKGVRVVTDRLTALGSPKPAVTIVPHEQAALVSALKASGSCDLVLVLGGSATSDRRDVAPAAVVPAGGVIERFGMPVDPGNLLAMGRLNDAPLVILPGCARSPALNGADWVLERLAARIPVTGEDIAAMGVGGLLKEIPSRPQPREAQ